MNQLDLFSGPPRPWRRQTLAELELEAERGAAWAQAHAQRWGSDNPRAIRGAFSAMILFAAVDELRRREAKDRQSKGAK